MHSSKPSILLSAYNALSLFVLFICVIIIAALNTYNHIQDEKHRSAISYKQLEGFFSYQYRAIAEEAWSGNYESISLRVKDIAKHFGEAKYSLYILNNNSKCLARSSTGVEYNENCFTSSTVLNDFNAFRNSHLDSELKFNLKLRKYVYLAALQVENKISGYVYVEIDDPYDFYRGSLISNLWHGLALKLLIIACIWLLWIFLSWRFILKPYYSSLVNIEKKQALGTLAAQVAHDIQSPLAALEMMVYMLTSIAEDNRTLIRSAIGRIRDISKSLLTGHKETVNNNISNIPTHNEGASLQHIGSLIESVITEKRCQFRDKISISIEPFQFNEDNFSLFVAVQPSNFKRVLSNLINNAIEAIQDSGKVSVTLHHFNNNVEILIKDNGVGIAPEIINKLGQEGLTYGKSNGHGLGIFSAKKILRDYGGKIIIKSELEKGTTIKIVLPKERQPEWFISALVVKQDSIICVIDDDHSIHQIWQKRLSDLNSEFFCGDIKMQHFSCPNDLQDWHSTNRLPNANIIYLCDYEFTEKGTNGISSLKNLGVESQSILVTSHYEESNIQQECLAGKIKLLPKNMAALIPITYLR